LNLCLLHINKEVFIPFGSSLLKRLLEIQVGNGKVQDLKLLQPW
jgi:hypothetical protein